MLPEIFKKVIKDMMTNRTIFETYIFTFWFIIISMVHIVLLWLNPMFLGVFKIVITLVTIYIYYNILKTYMTTRTIIEEI